MNLPMPVMNFITTINNMIPSIKQPQICDIGDGIIQLSWDYTNHLDVDFYPNGDIEWFYYNYNTNKTDSGSGINTEISILSFEILDIFSQLIIS
jgi:hypothetical protein